MGGNGERVDQLLLEPLGVVGFGDRLQCPDPGAERRRGGVGSDLREERGVGDRVDDPVVDEEVLEVGGGDAGRESVAAAGPRLFVLERAG